MADRHLVLAVFLDELAADSAAAHLKQSGIADVDAMGILVLDADDKLKRDKVGAHSTGQGAAIGRSDRGPRHGVPGPGRRDRLAVGALHDKSLRLGDADEARLSKRAQRRQARSQRHGGLRLGARDLQPPDPARRHARALELTEETLQAAAATSTPAI
jgi:hypothetical protein